MTDSTEHHETRRKDPVIVERAQRWLKVHFSWYVIGAVVGAIIVLALLFVLSSWVYSSIGASGITSGSGVDPTMILIALLVILGLAAFVWLVLRARPAAATAAAGATGTGTPFRVPTWVIVVALIVLLWVFWAPLVALFPAGTQVRLVAFMDALLANWVLVGLVIAAVLLLLRQRTAAIVVAALALLAFFFMPDTSGLSKSDKLYTYMTTPAPRLTPTVTPREEVWARNTSRDCPGKLLGPFRLSTAEVKFNPNGCYFYALGNGTVKFSGLFFGDLTVDLRTGAGDSPAHSKVYAVRAAHTPVEWQYILCSAPKKDMSTLDCK